MIRRFTSLVLPLAFAAASAALPAGAATPPPARAAAPANNPNAAAVVAYVRAFGSGDYAKAYGMLSGYAQRYFGNVRNYASVWSTDSFKLVNVRALKVAPQKNLTLVVVSETASYLDQLHQTQKQTTFTVPYVVVKENGALRVDDEQHPYRSFVPSGATVEHDGARVTVRKLSFFARRIEVYVTFENVGDGFITFLPYGRSVFRDETTIYQPFVTKDWYLTDQQLFLGLRLAALAQYTAPLNFQAEGRTDDRARTYSLRIAPALREGGDAPLEFALPPIAVPAP